MSGRSAGGSPRWLLKSIRVQDFLGYQGSKEVQFEKSLQVIEAPNHSGKTSIALGALWALTGQIPNLTRINKTSFRLTNKHAGASANTEVELALDSTAGTRLVILRRDVPGSRTKSDGYLEVRLDEDIFEDDEAEAVIHEVLKIEPTSLEGCGVVLQDHRLKLVTGSPQQIAEVVNDMLGLVALSDTVPALREGAREAKGLSTEFERYLEGNEPLERFEQRATELAEKLSGAEQAAALAGFAPEEIDDPEVGVEDALTDIAKSLNLHEFNVDTGFDNAIDYLRESLGRQRTEISERNEIRALQADEGRIQSLAKDTGEFAVDWDDHSSELIAVAGSGTMDDEALANEIASIEKRLTDLDVRRTEITDEQGFLQAAYDHLLRHSEPANCPLCGLGADRQELLAKSRGRIDSRLARESEENQATESGLKSDLKATRDRLGEVAALNSKHQGLLQRAERIAANLEKEDVDTEFLSDRARLFGDSSAIEDLSLGLNKTIDKLTTLHGAIRAKISKLETAASNREAEVFQPIERAINAVRDQLVPLVEAAHEVVEHEDRREDAEAKARDLNSLVTESGSYSQSLNRISRALSEQQQTRASEAVNKRITVISGFFQRVAANPDFTELKFDTRMSRGQVTYGLRASSSRLRTLEDSVGHVLSEGDLSAAGIALLLGLATGDAHTLGFVLLDDPAQGMDPAMQGRLATELAELDAPSQIIVFTHQPEFAAQLVANGAASSKFGEWGGGMHHD